MPIFEIVLKGHQQITKLMEDIATITPFVHAKSQKHLQTLFDLFCKKYIKYHMAEDLIVYPALSEFYHLRSRIIKCYQAHDMIQNAIFALMTLSKENESWGARLMVIRDLILHNFKEEEYEIFPVARELLTYTECETLAKKFKYIIALRKDIDEKIEFNHSELKAAIISAL